MNTNKKCFYNYFTSYHCYKNSLHAEQSGQTAKIPLSWTKTQNHLDFQQVIKLHTSISVYKWKCFNRYVLLVSNYHGSEITTAARKDKAGQKKDILCPQVVRDYNFYMGGVGRLCWSTKNGLRC